MQHAKKKVLIIDDNEDTLQLVHDLLESSSMECLTSSDAVDGLKIAIKEKPQLILLDLMLPQMSGFGVMREFKNHPELKGIPIVVFSALGDEEIASEAIELGASGYLRKACTSKELLSMVKEYTYQAT